MRAGALLLDRDTKGSVRVRAGAKAGSRIQVWSKPGSYDRYRGVIRLRSTKSGIDAINETQLDLYLRGRRPGRDAGDLAGRGAPGPGDRRPELRRPPAPPEDRLLGRLRRRAVPGLPGLARRAGGVDEGDRRYGRAGPAERDVVRQHAVPLDRRRGDRGQRERVHERGSGRSSPAPCRTCGARPTGRPTARPTTPPLRTRPGRRRPTRSSSCRRSSAPTRGRTSARWPASTSRTSGCRAGSSA